MLQGCILIFCAYRDPLRTLQEYKMRDVMDALRSATHSVPEGDGDADNVADSPPSVPSTVLKQKEEEEKDVENDGPGNDSAAQGVVCTQHSASACASCA